MKRLQVALAAGAVVLVIGIVLALSGGGSADGGPEIPAVGNGTGDTNDTGEPDGTNGSDGDGLDGIDPIDGEDVPTADPDGDAAAGDGDLDVDEISATWVTNGRAASTVTLEVADSPLEHERGLAFRDSMPADYGMLFVFEDEADRAFWMKDMRYSLDIIFLDEAGRVINVETADPAPDIADSDLPTYESAAPAMYVVEMNAGFAERNGIDEGSWLAFESPNGGATGPDAPTPDEGDADGETVPTDEDEDESR